MATLFASSQLSAVNQLNALNSLLNLGIIMEEVCSQFMGLWYSSSSLTDGSLANLFSISLLHIHGASMRLGPSMTLEVPARVYDLGKMSNWLVEV